MDFTIRAYDRRRARKYPISSIRCANHTDSGQPRSWIVTETVEDPKKTRKNVNLIGFKAFYLFEKALSSRVSGSFRFHWNAASTSFWISTFFDRLCGFLWTHSERWTLRCATAKTDSFPSNNSSTDSSNFEKNVFGKKCLFLTVQLGTWTFWKALVRLKIFQFIQKVVHKSLSLLLWKFLCQIKVVKLCIL